MINNRIKKIFCISDIFRCLKHRYPFLLIDKIIEFNSNYSITVIKNVTINEQYFQGHFPSEKIVPGVLILESIAQASGIFLFKNNKCNMEPKLYYLVGIHHAKFKQTVIPGDQMVITVVLLRSFLDFYRFVGTVYVKNNVVCQSEITCIYRI